MNDTIDRFDAALQRRGGDVVLRRKTGPNIDDVTVRAHVRTYRQQTEQLVAGIYRQAFIVRISPTQIKAAGWPQHASSPAAAPFDVDPSIPVIGDQVIIKGKIYTVKNVDPLEDGDVVVRINMIVEGG